MNPPGNYRIVCRHESGPPAFQVCGETTRVCVAEALWAQQQPELAVIDPTLDGGGGWELLRRMAHGNPPVPCVAWLHGARGEEVVRALQAGARSVILRDEAPETMLEAFLFAAATCSYLSPRVGVALAEHMATPTAVKIESPTFNGRQGQVFSLLGRRHSVRQIAEAMGISEKTVQTHVQRLKVRLRVRSQDELRWRAGQVAAQEMAAAAAVRLHL